MASVAGPRPACGVHLSGPLSGPWLSGRPVSSRPVSGRPVSSRPVSSRPVSSCPVASRLVSAPSVRTRPSGPPSGGGVWGQAGAARQPAPRGRVEVPVGCGVVERLGSTAEQARTRATPPGSRMVGGAVGGGPGPGRVRAAAAVDVGLPGRPGRRAERPSPAAARGHGRRPQREVAAPAAWLPSSGWVGDHGGWWSWRLPPAWTGPEGPMGVPAGMGVRPQRGPGRQRAFPACCRQRSDLRRWLVGLPGLEPGTSS
jgi:hypothetical protein